MNEVQLLRRQMALEREHSRDISRFNSIDYIKYITYYIARERARAKAHIGRLRLHEPLTPTEQTALTSLREALDETADLDAAVANGGHAPRITLLHKLIDAAAAIEPCAERYYSVEDWRSVAQVSADSILEERRLWAEAIQHGTVAPEH